MGGYTFWSEPLTSKPRCFNAAAVDAMAVPQMPTKWTDWTSENIAAKTIGKSGTHESGKLPTQKLHPLRVCEERGHGRIHVLIRASDAEPALASTPPWTPSPCRRFRRMPLQKNGFCAFSSATVVNGPWPGHINVSGGSVRI